MWVNNHSQISLLSLCQPTHSDCQHRLALVAYEWIACFHYVPTTRHPFDWSCSRCPSLYEQFSPISNETATHQLFWTPLIVYCIFLPRICEGSKGQASTDRSSASWSAAFSRLVSSLGSLTPYVNTLANQSKYHGGKMSGCLMSHEYKLHSSQEHYVL